MQFKHGKHRREHMWELVTSFCLQSLTNWGLAMKSFGTGIGAILCVFFHFSNSWLFDSAPSSSTWNGFISPQTSFKAQVTSFQRPRQKLQPKAQELWNTEAYGTSSLNFSLASHPSRPALGLFSCVLHFTFWMLSQVVYFSSGWEWFWIMYGKYWQERQ